MSSTRRTRPDPQRTQPIRNWSTLFAVPTGDAAQGAAADGEPAEPVPDTATGGPMGDVVSRSVDLGYRVIDEYVRQGQKAAERMNSRSYPAQAMANDLQDLGMRMTQYASDFAAVWIEFVQLAAKNGGPLMAAANNPVAPVEGGAPPAAPVAAAATAPVQAPSVDTARVRIEVVASQPTEVSLDIRPSAVSGPLLVHALRAVDPEKPRISEVAFVATSGDESPRLRICVPAGQPAGTYSGLIIEEQTSRPAGSVSIRVGDA